MRYKGGGYAAAMAPLVHAFRAGVPVLSAAVDFELPGAMRGEEEGSLEAAERRLGQVNELAAAVKEAWVEDLPE
ncbi:hypothetical protein TeGR_g14088 [Tetraparma gracilis]|uniref:Uncharacterized protein n=1 Tax=Tetraparma gracilis TaxID=2962635 RepID=A0ABQ6N7J5_9STRA|nr:hypothetical protein TeGR_g14088 [Tetraparma gracilis]